MKSLKERRIMTQNTYEQNNNESSSQNSGSYEHVNTASSHEAQGYGYQGQQQAPQGYGYQPQYAPAQGMNQYADPGFVYNVLSLVFVAVFPIAGAILGFIGRKKSREAGFDGQMGNLGFILNLVLSILVILAVIAYVGFFISMLATMGNAVNNMPRNRY